MTQTDLLMLRSEEHTSELQSLRHLVCRLLLETTRPSPRTTLFPYTTLFRSNITRIQERSLFNMTIHHKPRRPGLAVSEAKRRIRAIVHANPAIEGSMQDLIDHDPNGPLNAKIGRAHV